MTRQKHFITLAQDSYTEQFHEVPLDIYRNLYEGLDPHRHYTGHCGILDTIRGAAVIFIDEEIPVEHFENFKACCSHLLRNKKPIRVTRIKKPSVAKANQIALDMIEKLINDINSEFKSKLEGSQNPPPNIGYGELGFDDFRDATGNDTWGGDMI